MLAPLRRCVDGWPCMVSDLRGRKMRTGSKIGNPSTSSCEESRELQLLLFYFLCNLNRAAYKWCAKILPIAYIPRHDPVNTARHAPAPAGGSVNEPERRRKGSVVRNWL